MATILENFRTFDIHHLNMLLMIGIAIFFATAGAHIFQKLRIPQVVGYVAMGIVLGPMLKIIPPQVVESFRPISMFALGIIGFLIGGELKKDIFVKYGKQVFYILLYEGIAAAIFAGLLCFLALMLLFDWRISLAAAVVFGAICSATDPASTVAVLWEYKCRGPLTTMLITIVALDDALAVLLYIISVAISGILTGAEHKVSLGILLLNALYEAGGSLIIGFIVGMLLKWLMVKIKDSEKLFIATVGIIIVIVGLAMSLGFDVILSSMACGATLINTAPKRSKSSFETIHRFSSPLYVLFFVIIGATLDLSGATKAMLPVLAAYIVGTVIGKTAGSWFGAISSGACASIRKYLGFSLYQQGTVAIALLIAASARFEGQVRAMMLSVIIAGIFIFQLFGPMFVKNSVKKAGEAGLDVTEEDLIRQYSVREVMDTSPATLREDLPLDAILDTLSKNDNLYYPVVDEQFKLKGVVTLAGIKETFAHQAAANWLLACDIARPADDKTTWNTPLANAIEHMKQFDIEYMPVVSGDDNKLVGVINARAVNRKISAEVVKKHKQADEMATMKA
ncbi:MAG: cation:proton antiporter [Sedimentisphaerales bacterium]